MPDPCCANLIHHHDRQTVSLNRITGAKHGPGLWLKCLLSTHLQTLLSMILPTTNASIVMQQDMRVSLQHVHPPLYVSQRPTAALRGEQPLQKRRRHPSPFCDAENLLKSSIAVTLTFMTTRTRETIVDSSTTSAKRRKARLDSHVPLAVSANSSDPCAASETYIM